MRILRRKNMGDLTKYRSISEKNTRENGVSLPEKGLLYEGTGDFHQGKTEGNWCFLTRANYDFTRENDECTRENGDFTKENCDLTWFIPYFRGFQLWGILKRFFFNIWGSSLPHASRSCWTSEGRPAGKLSYLHIFEYDYHTLVWYITLYYFFLIWY